MFDTMTKVCYAKGSHVARKVNLRWKHHLLGRIAIFEIIKSNNLQLLTFRTVENLYICKFGLPNIGLTNAVYVETLSPCLMVTMGEPNTVISFFQNQTIIRATPGWKSFVVFTEINNYAPVPNIVFTSPIRIFFSLKALKKSFFIGGLYVDSFT